MERVNNATEGVMEHRKTGFDFEKITVSFRLLLPVMLTGYIVAWGLNTNWQNEVQSNSFNAATTP